MHGPGEGVVAIGDVKVVVAVNGDGGVRSDAVGGVDGGAHPRTRFVRGVVQIIGRVSLVGDVNVANGIVDEGIETAVISAVLNGGGRPCAAGVVGVLQRGCVHVKVGDTGLIGGGVDGDVESRASRVGADVLKEGSRPRARCVGEMVHVLVVGVVVSDVDVVVGVDGNGGGGDVARRLNGAVGPRASAALRGVTHVAAAVAIGDVRIVV